jgi:hypothetical protein
MFAELPRKNKGLFKILRIHAIYLAVYTDEILHSTRWKKTDLESMRPNMRSTRTARKRLADIIYQLLFMAVVVAIASSTGCVRKRMTVRTNPAGAMVYIDKQPIGLTPVSTNFTYYGTRNIEIVRDGYRTERFLRKFSPPWYEIPPLDFFSESLWPFEKRDERIVDVELTPEPIVPNDALIASAEQIRLQASQGVAVSSPPTLVPIQPITILPPIANTPYPPGVVPNAGPSPFGTFNANPPILGPVGP